MPILIPSRELESEFLNWIYGLPTMHGILINGPLAQVQALVTQRPLTWAQLVSYELTEGGAAGYTRASLKPIAAPVPTYNAGANRTETTRGAVTLPIPTGQSWSYFGTGTAAGTRDWANRLISTVAPAADTIAFPVNGATFTNGDRVIITADAGGALPGGVGVGQIYTLQSLSMTAGTATAKLRAAGAATDIDILSAGSGSLRLRSVDGFLLGASFEGSVIEGEPVLSSQTATVAVTFGLMGAAQGALPSAVWPIPA